MATPKVDEVDFCGFSLAGRYAVTEDGSAHPIIEMWDQWGQDTDEEDEVCFVVVDLGADRLVTFSIDDFEDAPLN